MIAAILGLVLLALPSDGDVPREAVIVEDGVELLDEPDDAAFSTGRLSSGQKVTIRREGPTGWIAIEPPEGCFSLIEETDIEELEDGRGRVTARFASVRPGREGAKFPGPPRLTLKKGTIVRLLDHRPIVLRRDRQSRTWLAIEPPPAEVRFLRVEAVGEGAFAEAPRRGRLVSRVSPPSSAVPVGRLESVDTSLFAIGPDPIEGGLSPAVSSELARIAVAHRRALQAPIDRWDLRRVRTDYVTLASKYREGNDRSAIALRIAAVERQEKASQSARAIAGLIEKSRRRDSEIAELAPQTSARPRPEKRDYDAMGLLQTSSRRAEGRRLLVLLGEDGAVVAYLLLPPGLSAEPYLLRQVGVRGEPRFDENLKARLILVRDLEEPGDAP